MSGILQPKFFEPFSQKARQENSQRMKEFFYERLDKAVDENQHRKNPYYITYKVKFDHSEPWKAKDIMKVHDEFPETLIAGTIVYTVDNSKGSCKLLRIIEP